MHLSDSKTDEAISLLTRLAYGDVAIVRDALSQYGDDDPKVVIEYIRARRDPSRRPPGTGAKSPAPS